MGDGDPGSRVIPFCPCRCLNRERTGKGAAGLTDAGLTGKGPPCSATTLASPVRFLAIYISHEYFEDDPGSTVGFSFSQFYSLSWEQKRLPEILSR